MNMNEVDLNDGVSYRIKIKKNIDRFSLEISVSINLVLLFGCYLVS